MRIIKKLLLAFVMTVALFGTLPTSAHAWEDRGSYYQSDTYRQDQQREQDHTDRLNRETRQREEDGLRQREQYRQDQQRADESRSYGLSSRDASGTLRFQTCNATRYQTICQ